MTNKFTIIALTVLIATFAEGGRTPIESSDSPPAAAAGNLRSGRKLQITAYYYGFGAAKKAWEDGGYACTSDDAQEFEWTIGGDERICTDQYSHNSSYRNACNDGIQDYVSDKKNDCFASVDQCEGIGEAIADGIIATHCVLSDDPRYAAIIVKRTWPKECKKIGIQQCQEEVSSRKAYKGYDSSCSRPTGSLLNRLVGFCETEVNEYLSGTVDVPVTSPTPAPAKPTPRYNKLSNTACGFGGDAEEGVDMERYEDVSIGWCRDKCSRKRTCYGYDYDPEKDGGRCRVFLEYPWSQKYKKGVTCYLMEGKEFSQ